jgi:hypothetical protein
MDPILLCGLIFAFVLAVGMVGAATRGPKAPGYLRVLGIVFLLTVAAFCLFGFLASFEVVGVPAIGIIYAVVGVSSLMGASALATYQPNSVKSSS